METAPLKAAMNIIPASSETLLAENQLPGCLRKPAVYTKFYYTEIQISVFFSYFTGAQCVHLRLYGRHL
jgi:hypothetical protein